MKRIFTSMLAVILLISASVCVSAKSETVLTLDIPDGADVPYTGNRAQDAFALAIGYALSDECVGLSGYAVTVRWDPLVFALNTNYHDAMTDEEMANATGCYFRDLYNDGLVLAPSGLSVVNYRNVSKGEITVVSIGSEDYPYREAVLFVLDMIPLCDDTVSELSVEVKKSVGMTSSNGMIQNYQSNRTLLVHIGDTVLRGDANADGKLTTADALRIKRHVLAEQPLTGVYLFAADTDGNGSVSAKDYLLVCKKIQNK